ncbi:MAG: Gfo/Idh/MocA family oxidoreductase [Victivallaceae bacterium]|nr:Gfo/Idh/MocA family oxidoreductase [Victivallaceae bacterium]
MTGKPIIGIVGCGHRMTGLATYINDKVEIRAICEPNAACIANFQKIMPGDYHVTSDYDELLNMKDIDWVLIGSPNNVHKEHIVKAFEVGKHVFAEKPLATTLEDCVTICQAHEQSGKQFATGFVLRFSPHYRKIKELLDDGVIGDIVSFEFDECIPHYHGGHIMKGWRRLKEISGGHIVEKCCHDIDLANWFVDSLATSVASFGGLNFFTPENSHIVDEIGLNKDGRQAYSEWQHVTTEASCPFKTAKSIIDNQVAIIEYRNGVRATFHASLNTGLPKRGFYICGTRGTLETEWYSGKILLQRIKHDSQIKDFSTLAATAVPGHGGGDEIIMEDLYETMVSCTEPLCGGKEGLLSTVTAIAIQKAMEEKQVIEMDEIWSKVGII